MSRRHLTSKQHAFLEFLRDHVETRKIWPTYREIVDHFDYRSPNSVTQNLQALSRKGFLQRDRNGYQLVDQSGRDGSVELVGTVRTGHFERDAEPSRFSLADLADNLTALRAVRVADDVTPSGLLADARFVLVTEGDPADGDLALVIDGTHLSVAATGPGGRPAGLPVTAFVLGRYAGHAGPGGITLAPEAPLAVSERPASVFHAGGGGAAPSVDAGRVLA